MRTSLVGMVLFTSLAAGCVASSMDDMPGDDGVSVGGWTSMPLPDDTSNPDRAVYHGGNDLVSGIYYESADKGFIVSQGAGETATRGGAVFTATGSKVTGVAFSGDGTGLGLSGSIDFVGLEKTPSGYIAMAYASDVIQSRDGGVTFSIERNGSGGFGIEPVLAYKVSSSGTTLVRKTGVVTVSSSAPGSSASYTDIWAPNASPSIPAQVPADQCQDGPLGTGTPTTRYSVHASADRNFLAYTADPEFDPQICISTDGGHTFYPHRLTVPSADDSQPPTGIVFTSATAGITWFASTSNGTPYIQRTTDGGMTWTNVSLPSSLASHSIMLPAAHFLADGMHGWLAGYDSTAASALLLATADGGSTWQTVDGVADAVKAANGDKLYSVFALDAAHVWIGGARGVLLHN